MRFPFDTSLSETCPKPVRNLSEVYLKYPKLIRNLSETYLNLSETCSGMFLPVSYQSLEFSRGFGFHR